MRTWLAVWLMITVMLTVYGREAQLPAVDETGMEGAWDMQQNTQGEWPDSAKEQRMTLTVGAQEFDVTLEDNAAAQALYEMLPLRLEMSELNGNEKYHYLDQTLPADAQRPGQINAGDLMLFGDDCIVLFYESFSSGYSYTRLGRVENAGGLAGVLGRGSVTVELKPAQ